MSDGKTKKNSWFSWLIIGIAFIVVVVVLLLSFLKEGKATATMTAEDTLLSSANVWASQLSDTLTLAEKTGGMINDYITDKGSDNLTDETVYLMDKVVKNTPFYRIMVSTERNPSMMRERLTMPIFMKLILKKVRPKTWLIHLSKMTVWETITL